MPDRALTPREVARLLRVRVDRVREWIASGELSAINTAPARCGRPRYVVLPEQLVAWTAARSIAASPPPPRRKRKAPALVDYYT
jgi:excisionase family DNA binding protein